ncbi:MAG: hypothetical protein AAFN78_07855 [Pseudomonadota bacterium]
MTTDNFNNGPTPTDEALRRAAARLPDSIEPARDLWPDIAKAIATGSEDGEADATPPPMQASASGSRWMPTLAAAASLGAVALVVLASLRSGLAPEQTPTVADVPEAAAPVSPVSPVSEEQEATEEDDLLGPAFLRTRDELESSLDERLAGLSPQTRQVVESNLRQIEQSLVAIREALELEPDNTSLHHLLTETSRQQLELRHLPAVGR